MWVRTCMHIWNTPYMCLHFKCSHVDLQCWPCHSVEPSKTFIKNGWCSIVSRREHGMFNSLEGTDMPAYFRRRLPTWHERSAHPKHDKAIGPSPACRVTKQNGSPNLKSGTSNQHDGYIAVWCGDIEHHLQRRGAIQRLEAHTRINPFKQQVVLR